MTLTEEQKTEIKKILAEYHRKLEAAVNEHIHNATKIVEQADKEKAEKIKQIIEGVQAPTA